MILTVYHSRIRMLPIKNTNDTHKQTTTQTLKQEQKLDQNKFYQLDHSIIVEMVEGRLT